MKRKVLTILLAVATTLCMASTAFAATYSAVSASADRTAGIKAGDQVTVTLSAEGEMAGVVSMGYSVHFDSTQFEYVSSTASGEASWSSDLGGYYSLQLFSFASNGATVPSGTLGTITFKALADATAGEQLFSVDSTGIMFTDNTSVTSDNATLVSTPVVLATAPHQHSFAETWSYDADGHWKACTDETCGDKDAADKHDFGEWEVTKPATETEKGEKARTCECGYSETDEIAATGSSDSDADNDGVEGEGSADTEESEGADSSTPANGSSDKKTGTTVVKTSAIPQTGDGLAVAAVSFGSLALLSAVGLFVARKKGFIG